MNQVEKNEVILVNSFDEEIGTMEKLEAHQKGLLHRAFSIFIFNSKGEFLLQKRALGKYHSEGLWTNTCCSHPAPGETIEEAAVRRLNEEMGMVCELKSKFSFIYNVQLDNDLIEHELDHVVIGKTDADPILNFEEVSEFSWKSIKEIIHEVKENPEKFTSWFKIIFEDYIDELVKYIRHESL